MDRYAFSGICFSISITFYQEMCFLINLSNMILKKKMYMYNLIYLSFLHVPTCLYPYTIENVNLISKFNWVNFVLRYCCLSCLPHNLGVFVEINDIL